MMRSRLLIFLLCTGACSSRVSSVPSVASPPLRSLNSGLATSISVEPVRIEQGFKVWRQGAQVSIQDGLLIRLDGLSVGPSAFIPRAGTSPMFVLGDTIGVPLSKPLEHNKAILLMHSPPAGTEVPLWLTNSDELPHLLQGGALMAAQKAALSATSHDGLNVQTPPASAPRTVYPSLDALRLVALNMKMPPEICALAEKECGVVPKTPFGMIDCGSCGAGERCTPENTCCTVDPHASDGRTCGALSDR